MSAQRGFVINNMDDLGTVHASFEHAKWVHVAVEDRDGQAAILAEHESGDLYMTTGDAWVAAEIVVMHHAPITVLSEITVVPFKRCRCCASDAHEDERDGRHCSACVARGPNDGGL